MGTEGRGATSKVCFVEYGWWSLALIITWSKLGKAQPQVVNLTLYDLSLISLRDCYLIYRESNGDYFQLKMKS